MVFPSDLPTLPDANSRTESDGLTLRAKLVAILGGYKTYIEALGAKVGVNGSAVTTSLDYKIATLPLLGEDIYTAAHTIISANAGRSVTMNVAGAHNVTVPTLPAGTVVSVYELGAGQTTFVASGITLVSKGSKFKLDGQHAQASLWWRTATIVVVSGELVA